MMHAIKNFILTFNSVCPTVHVNLHLNFYKNDDITVFFKEIFFVWIRYLGHTCKTVFEIEEGGKIGDSEPDFKNTNS